MKQAERMVNEAKDHLDESIRCLTEVYNEKDMWGRDECDIDEIKNRIIRLLDVW